MKLSSSITSYIFRASNLKAAAPFHDHIGLKRRFLTSFLVGVSAAGLPESHHGSEVGSQHGPAEGRHGVDSHQAADEGVLAALEQGDDVRTHVVSVLLPEVLNEGKIQRRVC